MEETITKDEAKRLKAELGKDHRFRESYSGRGMFKKTCIGFVTENESALAIALSSVLGLTKTKRLVNSFRKDQMGKGSIIVYAPGWKVEE